MRRVREAVLLGVAAGALALVPAAQASHQRAGCLERLGHRLAVAGSDRLREVALIEYQRCVGEAEAQARIAAGTLRFTYREVPIVKTLKRVDADHNHKDSPGDYFTGRNTLLKGKRPVGVLRFKSTLVALTGTQATIHDQMTIRLPGGHLYADRTEAGDLTEQEHVGSSETYPITRGDGRLAGYTGQFVSVNIRGPGPTGPPIYRDTFTPTKGPA
jgi:hypothetical protein